MASLLPNGKQQFFDAAGNPLAGGSVAFYTPGTLTPKATWQDAAQTILNTNPVILDAAGEAIIYGIGAYRQIVTDSLANTIWDQITNDPASGAIVFAGTVGGTANAQTITSGSFSSQNGQTLIIKALLTNTGAATLAPNGGSALQYYKDAGTSPTLLTGGEMIAGGIYQITYDAILGAFHLLNPTPAIPTVTLEQFGGAGDGVTINNSALDSAIAALGSGGGEILLGSGTYAFSSNRSYSYPGTSPYSVTIRGRGQEVTKLYWAAGGGLTFNFSSSQHSIHVSNMSFYTGAVNTGVGLTLNNSVQLGKITRSDIINCSFLGIDGGAATYYWGNGISINGVSGITFLNCVFYGPTAGTTGAGIWLKGQPSGGNKYAINLQIALCDFLNIGFGIIYDSYVQGVTVDQCNFTNGKTGIYAPATATGSLAELFITACQFNVYNGQAVDLQQAVSQVVVTNSLFYINGFFSGIYALKCAGIIIIGNYFNYQTSYATGQTGIYSGTNVGGVPSIITGNVFWGLSNGILLDTGSLNTNVQSNFYFSCTTNTSNLGALNTIGGGSP